MLFSHFSFAVIFVFLHELCHATNTNVRNAFQWKFADNAVSLSLPQCSNVSLIVESDTSNSTALGTPPYYFMAFELGGVTTSDFVGTDPNSLVWQVNHQVGSKLMLTMADADGNAGGIPGQLYTVVPGQSSSCVPSLPATTLSVTANVTNHLTTCQPWGLQIKGGVEPYTVTLAQTNSPLVTNVTLGLGNDVLTYIDRADPNEMLLAVVSDATGQFGIGTSTVQTMGAPVTNQSCLGLVSTAGNSTQIQKEEQMIQQAAAAASRAHRRTVIIAVCVVLGALSVIVGFVVIYLFRRNRRVLAGGLNEKQDTVPRVFERLKPVLPSQLHAPQIKSEWSTSREDAFPLSSPQPIASSSAARRNVCQGDSSRVAVVTSIIAPNVRPNSTCPRPSSHPLSRKAAAERLRAVRSHDDLRRVSTGTSVPVRPLPPTRSMSATVEPTQSRRYDMPQGPSDEGGAFYQHRDGGRVREIPPPYGDFSGDRPLSIGSPVMYYGSPV